MNFNDEDELDGIFSNLREFYEAAIFFHERSLTNFDGIVLGCGDFY